MRGNDPITSGLVERARTGDRDAYDRLFTLVAERVLLYTRMRLGARLREKVDSMDILQDTYLAALRALPGYAAGDGAFPAWICRIAENCIRGNADHFGAKKRAADEVRVSEVLAKARATGTGPVTAAGRCEMRRQIEEAVERLEAEQREVLLLRFFEGRSLDEVAASTGRTLAVVRRLLGDAVVSLGGALGADGHE